MTVPRSESCERLLKLLASIAHDLETLQRQPGADAAWAIDRLERIRVEIEAALQLVRE